MENKIYELMEKMYSEVQNGFKELRKSQVKLENKVNSIEKSVLKIENEHGEKFSALFDAREALADQLNRIEEKVSRHDEFIIKRIK